MNETSTSSHSWPLVVAKKHGGSVRFTIDFRALNKIKVFHAEPIPGPEELFEHLAKAKYSTETDLNKSYWLIPARQDRTYRGGRRIPECNMCGVWGTTNAYI